MSYLTRMSLLNVFISVNRFICNVEKISSDFDLTDRDQGNNKKKEINNRTIWNRIERNNLTKPSKIYFTSLLVESGGFYWVGGGDYLVLGRLLFFFNSL